MRYSTTLLPFVATAAAIVVPDEATAQQLVLETKQQVEKTVSSWPEHILPSADDLLTYAEFSIDDIESFQPDANVIKDTLASVINSDLGTPEITEFLSPSDYTVDDGGRHGPHGPPHKPHGPHGPHRGHFTNLTVYQAIHASNSSTKFAKLVDDFPDLVEKLNGTSANVTLFVPTDKAFEKIPDHGKDKKPPKEFIEKIIQYHVLPGFYPAGRVISQHTLPTAWEEEQLGGRSQRIRVSASLFGVRLNFYSKIVFANLITSNGVVHAVDSILVPPPPAKTLISLFPSKFSTLELAAEKVGFTHHHHHSSNHSTHLTGLTFFAPTNLAFKKLGPRANAFLFNTPKGLHILKALLAYHVVANETLYSDAYYGKQKTNLSELDRGGDGHYHIDLPTLLGDKHIAVDIARWRGFIRVKLNGRVGVAIQDALAKNGVVQVVDSVLIPPHEHKGAWNDDGEIDVDDLVERFEPFVEGSETDAEPEVEAGEL